MELTRTSYIRILRIALAVIIIVLIASYAVWRSLNYARGPSITISSPTSGSTVDSSTLSIVGHVDRVNDLTMNGDHISIDEKGNFNQTIVVFPGLNKITFVADDQFGRSTQTELNIVGTADFKAPTSPITPVGTTTSSTTLSQ